MECPLRCPHCYADAGERWENELSLAEWKAVLREVREWKVPELHLLGGEVFCRADILELVREVAGFSRLDLLTNGIFIDAALARSLRQVGLRSIGISLDGARPESHALSRGDTFAAAIGAIRHLVEAGLVVYVNMILLSHNYQEVESVISLCRELGVSCLLLDCFVPVGRGVHNPRFALGEEHYRHVHRCLLPLAESLKEEMVIGWVIPVRGEGIPAELKADTRFEHNICHMGEHQLAILPDGNVIPCPIVSHQRQLYLGNVRENSLGEIWKDSRALRRLRRVPPRERCPFGIEGYLIYMNQPAPETGGPRPPFPFLG